MANIARDGAPKRTQVDHPPHPNMQTTIIDGVPPLPGLTKTTATRMFGQDHGLGEVHGGAAITPLKPSQK
jgi:hypothetical protein